MERCAVDTISQPGGSRTIIEDMAQVRVTPVTQHLRPRHHQRPVRLPPDIVRLAILRPVSLEERRPAGTRVKLVFAGEERSVTADTVIQPCHIESVNKSKE